jgi:isopenicillin-N N-acyltransferase-like protein
MVAELHGIAEAAGVTFDDVMLLQVRNQLQPDRDAGCTSLAWTASWPRATGNMVAQNWDNDPQLDSVTIVLTRRPSGKPALMTITQAGLIAYIGVNEAGIGLCLNTLPAPARGIGVPHYFTVRGIYEANSLEGAVAAVQRAYRAIPANIMMATPQGPADLEVTIDAVHVLRDDAAAGIVHSNHCKHPALTAIHRDFPELIQSHARDRRLQQLIDFRARSNVSVEAVMDALRDHQDHPRSICRHANDDPTTGFWQTVFSVVIEADQRRMHISRGTPCNHTYETYCLT